eukprot:TRINITY_DN406_c1_g1_i1.p1 TRINITY_DN406_c1_g1~~TRINITY_DN406_c1_g1_i1.p1  ORF type:complete len:865 (+),score=210.01 TRINITY_DN406_c1_g1_i1:78-2597(+)
MAEHPAGAHGTPAAESPVGPAAAAATANGPDPNSSPPPLPSEMVEQVGCTLFAGYVRRAGPAAEQLFRFSSLDRQRRMARQILDCVRAAVSGRPLDIVSLHRQAVYHAHLGIRVDDMHFLGEALFGALKQFCTDRFPGHAAEWQRAFHLIARFFVTVTNECSQAIQKLCAAPSEEEGKLASKMLRKILIRTYRTLPMPSGAAGPAAAGNASGMRSRASRQLGEAAADVAAAPAGAAASSPAVGSSSPAIPAAQTPSADGVKKADDSTRSNDDGLIVDHVGALWMSQYGAKGKDPPGPGEEHDRKSFKRRYLQLVGRYLYVMREPGDRALELFDVGLTDLLDTGQAQYGASSPSPFSFAIQIAPAAHAADSAVHPMPPPAPAPQPTPPSESPPPSGRPGPLRPAPPPNPAPPTAVRGRPQSAGREAALPVQRRTVWFVADGDLDKEGWWEKLTKVRLRFNPASRRSPSEQLPRCRYLGDEGWAARARPLSPDDFEELALVGRGSFGTVTKVRMRDTGQIFALKRVGRAVLEVPALRADTIRERDILLRLQGPAMVRLHATFHHTGRFYFLFDYYPGGDLFGHLKRSESLCFDNHRARFYAAEIIFALEYCRKCDIIHRDLKADNIMLDWQGHCVLTDFGFAVHSGQADRRSCGTLAYMAPEVITQQTCTNKVDWWSLGVLVFIMLTGAYPFLRPEAKATAEAICRGQIIFPEQPRVSSGAVLFVSDVLRKNPGNRPGSFQEIADHHWFRGFDWEAARERRLSPPFTPDPSGPSTKYTAGEIKAESRSVGAVVSEETAVRFQGLHLDYRDSSAEDAAAADRTDCKAASGNAEDADGPAAQG